MVKEVSSNHRLTRASLKSLLAFSVTVCLVIRGSERVTAVQSAQELTSAISGTVKDATTGAPIPGAVVSLFGGRGAAVSQSTDSYGRFIFIKLPPSDDYGLVAGRSGFAPMTQGQRVVLRQHQWVKDLDLQLQHLSAITGRVTKESGEPAVDVFVRAMARTLVAGNEKLIGGPVAKTDDRGVYRIGSLQPGRYFIEVLSVQSSAPAGGQTQPNGSNSTLSRSAVPVGQSSILVSPSTVPAASSNPARAYATTFHPSGRSPAEALLVVLGANEVLSNVDVSLAMVQTVEVSGMVEAPPEAQVNGLVLRLLPQGLEDLSNGNEIATATVASSGRFFFLGVPPGEYTLVGSRALLDLQVSGGQSFGRPGAVTLPAPPGFTAPLSAGSALRSGLEYRYGIEKGGTEYAGRVKVIVGSAALNDVVLKFQRGVTLSGRVVVEGRDVNKPRPPVGVGTFPVIAEPVDGDFSFGLPVGRMVPTDTGATFMISGLQPGRYLLRFQALGVIGAASVTSVTWKGRDYSFEGVEVPSSDVSDVLVTTSSKPAMISGRVKGPQDRVSRGTRVLIFPANPANWKGYGLWSSIIQFVLLDNNDEFKATVETPGEYCVVALDGINGMEWQDPAFLQAAAKVATRVEIKKSADTRTDLSIAAVQRIH